MPIIGLSLISVKASVDDNKKYSGSINVNSTPTIEKIEKRELNLPHIKEAVGIDFKFETKYEPKIGEIIFQGRVLYQTNKMKEVLEKWKKEKKLDNEMILEILNAIFRKCITKAIDITNELGLPPPIRFPLVKPKEQDEYIG